MAAGSRHTGCLLRSIDPPLHLGSWQIMGQDNIKASLTWPVNKRSIEKQFQSWEKQERNVARFVFGPMLW